MARDFYKTTITVEVLSERPLTHTMTLENIAYEMLEGEFVGQYEKTGEILCNGGAMAEELVKFGSCPGFFRLNRDGSDSE